ncbi:WD40 repeat domain-containing protein [Aeoliella mucimassa]|uniref:WD domain, G-beta repeat n=1 Tax=Aeoliella mucimassa TaxID=2527972 RepID=A0A518ARV6_9BACT|nr:WD40 repeat domain-containing protein [Aeoliella mucimassa]QDU57455.1 WD domain, G-beta repeat [Aeoliella mucimassa]
MDANNNSRRNQRVLALLVIASSWCSWTQAVEIPSIAPARVIPFGDPDALDANPQRRTAVVTAVVLSPDNSRLAAAGDDHKVRLFDTASGELIQELDGHHDWVRGLSITGDGETIVSAGADCCCRCWNIHTGDLLHVTQQGHGPMRCVAFHPNGVQFAAAGFCCPPSIYNYSAGNSQETRIAMQSPATKFDHTAVVFSPDGTLLAATSADGTLRVWRVATAELLHEIKADSRRLRAVAFSPNGQTIATGGDGAKVCLWDLQSGILQQEIPIRPAKVFCMSFVNDAELAVGGTDNRVQVWRVDSASLLKILEGHSGTITSLAVDTTSKLLVTGSFDTTIRVWHLDRMAETKTATRPVEATK